MLRVEKYIFSGRFRDVFCYPGDDDKLIKVQPYSVDVEAPEDGHAGKMGFMKSKRRRLSSHERELLGIDMLNSKGVLDSPYFVKYMGEIITDRGRGLIVERIHNFYFDDMATVMDYLQKHGKIADVDLRQALENFFDFLRRNSIYCACGGPENIAIVRDGSEKIGVRAFDVKVYPKRSWLSFLQSGRRDRRRLERQRKLILETDWENADEVYRIVRRTPLL